VRSVLLALAALAAGATGCSLKFDSAGDVWPLVGAAVDPSGLERVVELAGQAPQLVAGADGATWITTGIDETTTTTRIRLVRLGDPAKEEKVEAPLDASAGYSYFEVGRTAIYGYYPAGVIIHHPGGDTRRIDLAMNIAEFTHAPNGTAYAFVDGLTLRLRRTDGSYQRSFSSPASTGGVQGYWVTWSDDGDHALVFLWRDADQRFVSAIVDTRSEALVTLPDRAGLIYGHGEPQPEFGYLTDSPTALVCSSAVGLLAVPLDGSATTTLDPDCFSLPVVAQLCGPNRTFDCPRGDRDPPGADTYTRDYPLSARQIVYLVGISRPGPPRQLPSSWVARSTALDGGNRDASQPFQGALLDVRAPHVATAHQLAGNYSYSAPASVDGVPTVERGRALAFSGDGTRVRFLEHTADLSGAGDLMTGPVGGPYELIARNAVRYQELDDGRLIAVTNWIYALSHTRVVLIDEAARTVTRLIEGADAYVVLPGGNEALIRLQSTDQNRPDEWRRVPFPPRAR